MELFSDTLVEKEMIGKVQPTSSKETPNDGLKA